MRLSFFFAWYDFWIGFYWDRKSRVLYICPLPCCVFKLDFTEYYEIIGSYTGAAIGLTTDRESVLEEEPRATFRRISRKEYYSRLSDMGQDMQDDCEEEQDE